MGHSRYSLLATDACRVLAICILFITSTIPARAQRVEATLFGLSGIPVVNEPTNTIYFDGAALDGVTNVASLVPQATTGVKAANPATNRIYIASLNQVVVLDASTNSVVATIPITSRPNAIAVNSRSNEIYVVGIGPPPGLHGIITVIDGRTHHTTAIAAGSELIGLAINEVTNQIYVSDQLSSKVIALDGVTNHVSTIDTGYSTTSGLFNLGLAVNPVNNRLYITSGSAEKMVVVDGAHLSKSDVPLPGFYPAGLGVNPVTNKIYLWGSSATNASAGMLGVVSGVTNSLTTRVELPTPPLQMSINQVSNQIYLLRQSEATGPPSYYVPSVVDFVDGETDSLINRVGFGSGAQWMSFNATTNKLYVSRTAPLSSNDNVTVIECGGSGGFVVPAGIQPVAVAINPVSNLIYVADYRNGTVLVADGESNAEIASIAVGPHPTALAANPVTNRIYVAAAGVLTVINGASGTTTTIPIGSGPYAESASPQGVAVNPVTNKIYVTNFADKSVTVVDGMTNATNLISTGVGPFAIAVNPVTNKTYVANINNSSVTVIDGDTNTTKTVAVGSAPISLSIDTQANTVYTANSGAGTVSRIDGEANSVSTIQVGANPYSVAVDGLRHIVYAANYGDGTVTVINGVTGAATTVATGTHPNAIAVNPATTKAYVTNTISRTVTAINGAIVAADTVVGNTYYTQKLRVPASSNASYAAPYAIAVNAMTNKVYTVDKEGGLFIVNVNHPKKVPVTTKVSGIVDASTVSSANVFQTRNTSPSFAVMVTSAFTTTAAYNGDSDASNPPPTAVLYRVDGGSWTWGTRVSAQGQNPARFKVLVKQQDIGPHTLYVTAAYGNPGTPQGVYAGAQSSVPANVGNLIAYAFQVDPQ